MSDESIEALRERLQAAELVCELVGVNASGQTERGKALTQAWMDWARTCREHGWTPAMVPGEQIVELARRRDAIRAATLARYAQSRHDDLAARSRERAGALPCCGALCGDVHFGWCPTRSAGPQPIGAPDGTPDAWNGPQREAGGPDGATEAKVTGLDIGQWEEIR